MLNFGNVCTISYHIMAYEPGEPGEGKKRSFADFLIPLCLLRFEMQGAEVTLASFISIVTTEIIGSEQHNTGTFL